MFSYSNGDYSRFEERPPAFAPSYAGDLKEHEINTKLIGDVHIQVLRSQFYTVTKEAKALKNSLNSLFEPLTRYLADLQINNRTYEISGREVQARSLSGLIKLIEKQKSNFEQTVKPFLADQMVLKVKQSLENFENFVFKKIEMLYPKLSIESIVASEKALHSYQIDPFFIPTPTAPHFFDMKQSINKSQELKEIKGYTVFINHLLMNSLKEEFYKATAKAIGLQSSFNLLLEPLTEYLLNLKIKNDTQEIKDITGKSQSLNDLIQLIQAQKNIYKNEFKPYLAKDFSREVEASLNQFEESIYSYIKTFYPDAFQKYRDEADGAKHTICVARTKKCFDVLAILCCIGYCPIDFCCALCFSMLDELSGSHNFSREDQLSKTFYCFFPPCETIKKICDHYKEQDLIIEQAAPAVQRMI